jgi:hypothetical protein
MAEQRQPDNNDSEGNWRWPEEQEKGRRREPNNDSSGGVRRQPVEQGKPPGFCRSARERASVAKGTLQELRAIGNRDIADLPVRMQASQEGRCECSGREAIAINLIRP